MARLDAGDVEPAVITQGGSDTVAGVLEDHARRHPDDPFLVSEAATTTYAEMDRRANRMGHLLLRAGVGPGERFNVHLTNCPEFYDCWFGAAKIGAVMVPSNPLSTPDELGYLLDHARCRLSVTQPDLLGTVETARSRTGERSRVLVAGPVGEGSLADVLTGEPDTPPGPTRHPSEVLGVLYTSGTTSRPKGVLVTQAAYLHVGEVVAQHLRLRPEDRQLVVLPLFHGNAQYYSTMSALVTGASIALAGRFSASRWSEQASRLGATVASLFAAPIRMIMAQPPTGYDRAHTLRAVLFAQNITAEQLDGFEARFGAPLLQIYGMTETVAPPTMNPLYGQRRNMSIGRPALTARLRVVDHDGTDVSPGDVGELLVGGRPGETLMAGYLDNPEATADALRDGWLHTGDNVRLDADGYLSFVDRDKDMIKRAGENVASAEVERVVNEHPAVFESAAVGIPDPVRDEAIKVYVVLHDGAVLSEAELIEWCRTQLARFKVPSAVEVVDSLPRTSVGKIQKHLLRPRRPAVLSEP